METTQRVLPRADSNFMSTSFIYNFLVIFSDDNQWVDFILVNLAKWERLNFENCDFLAAMCGLFFLSNENEETLEALRLDFFDTILNLVFQNKAAIQSQIVKSMFLTC